MILGDGLSGSEHELLKKQLTDDKHDKITEGSISLIEFKIS